MKKVGITTVYTGFNYGSCLQAYATKQYMTSKGYHAEILAHKNGIIKGRDIRIGKLVYMFMRTFWRPSLFRKNFLTYKNSLKKEINNETKELFFDFYNSKIDPKKLSWNKLKKYARDNETLACICGSDQIWNATNVYIDPIFYLKFAPKEKRLAYAPSFGKNEIPNYNKKIVKKNVSEFNYISVREVQGAKIISDLLNREATVVIDPTLLLNKEKWLSEITNKITKPKEYILLYFLDKPTQVAAIYIKKLIEKFQVPVIVIPYKYDEFSQFLKAKYENAGPEQFIDLVANAKFVCTDSFHGMTFSANFNIPFYIFKRDYGTAVDQSSRIVSLLEKLSLKERFISEVNNNKGDNYYNIDMDIDFNKSNKLLEFEREKAEAYLRDAFSQIKKANK